jgi:exodeoxyribonuclease III
MKIVTWNVNSVRVRLEIIKEWLTQVQPDVVLLQEIKCLSEAFPYEPIEDLGYNVAVHGQKGFNGVAILAKHPIEDVICGLPTFSEDEQARYIEAIVGDVRVASVYVPNGQDVGTDKYRYKLHFLERLYEHLKMQMRYEEKFVIGGDYNIAPQDEDVHDPKGWYEQILCSTPERKKFWALQHLGLYDAIRLKYQGKGPYSWWDYRTTAWPKNEGLRIDHLLLSPQAVDVLLDTGIDPEPRGKDKASDHAPVWCQLRKEK